MLLACVFALNCGLTAWMILGSFSSDLWRRRVSTTFCAGRSRPEVQPFTPLYMYTIFGRQGVTFAYLFLWGNVMYGSLSHNY